MCRHFRGSFALFLPLFKTEKDYLQCIEARIVKGEDNKAENYRYLNVKRYGAVTYKIRYYIFALELHNDCLVGVESNDKA